MGKESKSEYTNIKGSAFVDMGFTKKFNAKWGMTLSARIDYSFVPIQPNFIPPRQIYTYGTSVNLGLRYLLK